VAGELVGERHSTRAELGEASAGSENQRGGPATRRCSGGGVARRFASVASDPTAHLACGEEDRLEAAAPGDAWPGIDGGNRRTVARSRAGHRRDGER
jgi:hypothetical protein